MLLLPLPSCVVSFLEYKFNIQFYKDSIEGKVGRAVMLYANKDGKKMVVCCNEKHEIHPVEMVSVNK